MIRNIYYSVDIHVSKLLELPSESARLQCGQQKRRTYSPARGIVIAYESATVSVVDLDGSPGQIMI